jgi:hypothetical protein
MRWRCLHITSRHTTFLDAMSWERTAAAIWRISLIVAKLKYHVLVLRKGVHYQRGLLMYNREAFHDESGGMQRLV